MTDQTDPRTRLQRLADAVTHSGPGYDLTPQPATWPAAIEATELDKSRRYLRPVRATCISDDPDGVHLAVYSWLPMFDAWVTGPGICGESMMQGPLPEGTKVTCASCLGWRPKYERMLAPGYDPASDDPEVLRSRITKALALHQPIGGDGGPYCETCTQEERQPDPIGWWVPFPCPTVKALTGDQEDGL
jgi:hypothetical protein